MLKLSSEQFDAMESRFRQGRRKKLAAAFVRDYPGLTIGVTLPQVMAYIDAVIADCGPPDRKPDDEIIEFAAIGLLCLRLATQQPQRVALIHRVVVDNGSPARRRLDFIWARLLPEYAEDRGRSVQHRID